MTSADGIAGTTGNSSAAGSRRKPAWIPTVATVAAVIVFVLAGNWQHRRMIEKEARQAALSAATALPVVALPAGVADWRSWKYRVVSLGGVYDATHQILVDNVVHAGRAGFDVVTPMALADGRIVLVNRGWVAGDPARTVLPAAPAPPGAVEIRGRIDLPPTRFFEFGVHAEPVGPLWPRLDLQRYAAATGLPVMPIVVDALQPSGAGDTLLRDWAGPDLGVGTHLSYMVQWYTFAVMAAGLWLWFTLRPRLRGDAT